LKLLFIFILLFGFTSCEQEEDGSADFLADELAEVLGATKPEEALSAREVIEASLVSAQEKNTDLAFDDGDLDLVLEINKSELVNETLKEVVGNTISKQEALDKLIEKAKFLYEKKVDSFKSTVYQVQKDLINQKIEGFGVDHADLALKTSINIDVIDFVLEQFIYTDEFDPKEVAIKLLQFSEIELDAHRYATDEMVHYMAKTVVKEPLYKDLKIEEVERILETVKKLDYKCVDAFLVKSFGKGYQLKANQYDFHQGLIECHPLKIKNKK